MGDRDVLVRMCDGEIFVSAVFSVARVPCFALHLYLSSTSKKGVTMYKKGVRTYVYPLHLHPYLHIESEMGESYYCVRECTQVFMHVCGINNACMSCAHLVAMPLLQQQISQHLSLNPT